MKPSKLLLTLAAVTLAAVICSFAVACAHAQTAITNFVTFSAVTYAQGSTNDNGTITTYGPIVKASHGTTGQTGLLGELGKVLTPPISTSAKLVLIAPQHSGPIFAVLDGATLYDLTSSNIMSLSFSDTDNQIRAGTQSDTTQQRNTTEMQLATLNYNDTNFPGGGLQFTLTGLATVAQSDTAPVNGTYNETIKAKVASMIGQGSSGGPFVATGSLTISGKGPLTVPVP